MLRYMFYTLLSLLLLVFAIRAVQSQPTPPKLIKWGWDQPTTIDLRNNIATMEQSPYDGVVLSAIGWDNPRRIELYRNFWGREAFTQTQFRDAVNDLKTIPFQRFTDNFLRLNISPGDVDWFDDDGWKAIKSNGELAAWICKEGNLKGIMFDTEQYQYEPFYYAEWPYRGTRTFDEYRNQARKRGKELARAMTAIKSDLIYMFTFGLSVFTVKNTWLGAQPPLPYSQFGLLPAFLDGMMEGANPKATFIDGLEVAYPTKELARFEELKQSVRDAREYSSNPRRYDARMKVGFGLWLDYGWPTLGWDPVNTENNYFQPEEFQAALEGALSLTDKYVWVYSEQVNWWTGIGLSPVYEQAVYGARQTFDLP